MPMITFYFFSMKTTSCLIRRPEHFLFLSYTIHNRRPKAVGHGLSWF